MSKTVHRALQAKMDKLQGPEWDSSDEEETEKKVVSKPAAKKAVVGKKGSSKKTPVEQKAEESVRDATVLFIGHLPNEFEERDLRNLLQQFGKLVNIRISRSTKSGNSRGYAFVRWEDAETARIVAETLQGYLIGGRRLVCHTVPNPNKHMFYNTDKVIEQRKLKRQVEEKKRASSLADVGKIKEITARLIKREQQKRAKLEELGIEYEFPGYEANLMTGDEEEKVQEVKQVPKREPGSEKKRKQSLDSSVSHSSPSVPTKKKDTAGSQGSAESDVKTPQTEKKTKKAKSNKKRRESAP